MKTILFLFALIFSTSVFAQKNLVVGINASADINSYFKVEKEKLAPYEPEGDLSYSMGLILRKYFNSGQFSINGRLNYSLKEYTFSADLDQIHTNDPLLSDEYKIKHIHRYIDIPIDISVKVNRSDKFDLLPTIGLVNSFSIGYKKEKTFSGITLDMLEEPRYKDYLMSAKFAVGILFYAGQMRILIEPQTRIYINSIHETYIEENPVHFGIDIALLKIR